MKKGLLFLSTVFAFLMCMLVWQDVQSELNAEERMYEDTSRLHVNSLIPKYQQQIMQDVLNEHTVENPTPLALNGSKLSTQTTIINPVIFVEFADDSGEWINDTTLAQFDKLYNSGANSVNAYFKKVSFGILNVESHFFPYKMNGESIVNEITAIKSSYPRGYIMPKSVSNPDGYDPSIGEDITNQDSYRYHELMVIKDIMGDIFSETGMHLTAAQINSFAEINEWNLNLGYTSSGFDWGPELDNIKTVEQVSADSVTFVFKGAVSSSEESAILWPHKYSYPFSSQQPFGLPAFDFTTNSAHQLTGYTALSDYVIVPADPTDTTKKMNMLSSTPNYGVVIHEFFHQFGAPDLYRLNYEGQAVGEWDLMGAQSEIPQTMLQYTTAMFGIWDTPDFDELSSTNTLEERTDVPVNVAKYDGTDSHIAVKIVPQDTSKKEYFVVEYRKKTATGFDSELPQSGLIIYRVHEDTPPFTKDEAYCGVTCGNMLTNLPGESTADEIFVFRPDAANATLSDQPSVDENLNKAAFPRTINGTKINAIGKSLTEVPASSAPADFDPDTLYFSDGTNSGIRIVDISDPGDTSMTFTVLYGDETVSNGITSVSAEHDTIQMRGESTIADNTITVAGGTSPYTFAIDEVKKDNEPYASHPFTLETIADHPEQQTLKTGQALGIGTYEIKVKVTDQDANEKTLVITYTIRPELPTNSILTYTNRDVESNATSSSCVVGSLSLTGCINDACNVDYGYDSAEFGISFLAGKDYSNYFQMTPLMGAGSGQISAKGKVPAGTYECKGTVTFKTQGENDVMIEKNISIVIEDDGSTPDPSTPVPTIADPTGEVLTATSWMNGVQNVSVTLSDATSLQSITVTTQNGTFFVEGQATKQFQKTYDTTTTNDTVLIPVYGNGTYNIKVKNTDGGEANKAFTIAKLDNVVPTLQIAIAQRVATVTASDQDSLIDTTTYVKTTDTTTDPDDLTYSETYTKPVSIENEFAGRFCAKTVDHAGNQATACETIQAVSDTSDTTAPTIATPTLSPNTWTNGTITMAVSMSDNDALASLQVTTENGEIKVGSDKKKTHTYTLTAAASAEQNVIITKNGVYTLTVSDQNGNTKTTTVTVKLIDIEGPLVKLNVAGLQADNSATITISATDLPNVLDEQSGVDEILYQYLPDGSSITDLNDADWTVYTAPIQRQNANTDNGKMCAKATDHAGNTGPVMCKVIHGADNDAPIISDTIQGLVDTETDKTGWTNAQAILLKFSVADAGSGIASISLKKDTMEIGTPYQNDGSTPVLSYEYEASVNENGNYTLYVTDKDGNTSFKAFTVNQFDRQGPVIDSVDLKTKMLFFLFPTGDQSLVITAHDLPVNLHSGIKEYRYAIGSLTTSEKQDDTTWKTLAAAASLDVKAEDQGTIYIYAYDYAGNRSALFEERIDRETQSNKPELKSLTTNEGTLTPAFSPSVYSYKIDVEDTITSIKLSAQAKESSWALEGDVNKTLSLKTGDNTFKINVMNGNDTQEYTIVVHRKEASEYDAHLKSLVPSAGTLDPAFKQNVLTYTMSVSAQTSSITLQAKANSTTAIIEGDANKAVTLKDGTNTLQILVKDGKKADGSYSEKLTYNITVVKASAAKDTNALLKSLSISTGTLTPAFSANTRSYKATVANTVSSITIQATAASTKASVTGDTGKQSLSVGENTFNITCTAEDGTKNVTTLKITREKEDPGDQKNPDDDQIILKDDTNRIQVIGNFDETFSIVSEEKTDVTLDEAWSAEYDLVDVFDIYITKDGKRFTVEDTVTVRIARKDDWKQTNDLSVVYIAEDGTITGMPTSVYDEYIEFTTDHFSQYAVISKKQTDNFGGADTGDTTNTVVYVTAITLAISILGVMTLRKRMRA